MVELEFQPQVTIWVYDQIIKSVAWKETSCRVYDTNKSLKCFKQKNGPPGLWFKTANGAAVWTMQWYRKSPAGRRSEADIRTKFIILNQMETDKLFSNTIA